MARKSVPPTLSKQQEKLAAIEAEDDVNALKDYIINVVLADDPYNGNRTLITAMGVVLLRWRR